MISLILAMQAVTMTPEASRGLADYTKALGIMASCRQYVDARDSRALISDIRTMPTELMTRFEAFYWEMVEKRPMPYETCIKFVPLAVDWGKVNVSYPLIAPTAPAQSDEDRDITEFMNKRFGK